MIRYRSFVGFLYYLLNLENTNSNRLVYILFLLQDKLYHQDQLCVFHNIICSTCFLNVIFIVQKVHLI
jgi:hypothetical protein